jgi:hypothetical protein
MKNVPDALKSLNINPLKVSAGKVVLAHKAEIESVIPVIKTKLTLQSVVGKLLYIYIYIVSFHFFLFQAACCVISHVWLLVVVIVVVFT